MAGSAFRSFRQALLALGKRSTWRPLWLGFGVLTLLFLLLGGFSTVRLRTISANVHTQADINVPRAMVVSELDISVLGYTLNVRSFPGGFAKARPQAADHGGDVARCLAEYEQLAVTPRQLELAARLAAQWQELHAQGEAILAASRASQEELARLEALGFALDQLLEDEVEPDASAAYDARKIATLSDLARTNSLTLLLLAGGVAVALVTSTAVARMVLGAQAALRQSEERLRLAARATGFGTYEFEPASERCVWSPELYAILGLPETLRLDPQIISELVHTKDREQFRASLQRTLDPRGPGRHEIEFRLVRPDGEERWVRDTGCLYLDQDQEGEGTGNPTVRVIGTLQDITARKKAEIQLATSLRDLREAQHELIRQERLATLGQLAGRVAHEIRTPLGVIQNSVYFLEHTPSPGDETMREVLAEMKRAVWSSDDIITQMLDYVREPSPCPSVFPIGDAISRALHFISLPETVHLQGLSGEAADIEVCANQDQVTRILVNLIRNAVQAMPQGGELKLDASREHEGKVSVEICDRGCGIPEENLEKIFDPLFSTKLRGIGLGLAIAQRYAQLNGGDLSVESEVGRGTTFRLTIPT